MLYGAMKVAIGGPLKVTFRPWVEGLEHIPAEGPAILASNHLSFSDSFFLPAVLDRKVTFIAKAEYFTTPGVKGRLTAAFFKGVGQLPVHLRVPVLPAGELHVLPAGAVSRQQGQRDGETALGEILRPGAKRLRGAGETVAEKDTDLSALVAERLGSRKDRHLGLLFMRRAGTTPGVLHRTRPY